MTAPVQVLVVGFNSPAFSGEVLAELDQLRRSGVVRLLDLLLVRRAEDGTIETVDLPEKATTAGLGEIALALLSAPDATRAERASALPAQVDAALEEAPGDGSAASGVLPEAKATWSLEDAVPPGTTAAVALIEHVWAESLTLAIKSAGGHWLEETWLGASDMDALEGVLAGRSH